MNRVAAGAGVAAGATLLMSGVAEAACTCTVDSLADPTEAGHTTLRNAITSANANPGSTITFAAGLSGTIGIAPSQLPTITSPTTITGPGAGLLTVSGGNNYRVFETNSAGVTISGLTITNGLAGTSGAGGAGVRSDGGSLTLSGDVITGNHTFGAGTDGGGISVQSGTLTVTGSTISGNTAGDRGGGINTEEYSAGVTTITSSTISGNQSGGPGGGAYLAYQSQASIYNSTIYGNTAGGNGGGVYHFGAPNPPGIGLVVTGSTLTHNTAARGGGIASFGSVNRAQPALRNTIIAGNTSADGPDLSANSGSMSAAFSLVGSVDSNTTINQTGPDIFGQDPQLGPLAANGGTTQTQKPAASSPVVDAGDAFGLTSDQRGSFRPFENPISNAAGGDGSDIGAVELQADDIPTPPDSTPTTTPGTTTTTTRTKKCKKKHPRFAESAKKKCKKRRG